jgi:hemerythrin-like metal-binding protein
MRNTVMSDSLLTGVSAIDADHKRLIETINKLENVSNANESRPLVKEILISLLDYSKYHFEREEKLMQVAVGYNGTSAHKMAHQEFIKRVDDYVAAFCAGQEFTEDMTVFLYEWFVNHISKTDKELVAKLA